jgi:hypothetical protein
MEDQMQVLSEDLGLLIEEFRIRRSFEEQLAEQFTQSAFIAPSLGRAKKEPAVCLVEVLTTEYDERRGYRHGCGATLSSKTLRR